MRAWLRAHETAAVGLLMVAPGRGRGRRPDRLSARPRLPARASSPRGSSARRSATSACATTAQVLDDPTSIDAIRHTFEYVLLAVSLELVLGVFVAVTLRRALPAGAASCSRSSCSRGRCPPSSAACSGGGSSTRTTACSTASCSTSTLIHQPHVWLAGGRWAIAFITIVHVWGVLPLVSLIFLAGLQSIPRGALQRLVGRRRRRLAPVPPHHAAAAAPVDRGRR